MSFVSLLWFPTVRKFHSNIQPLYIKDITWPHWDMNHWRQLHDHSNNFILSALKAPLSNGTRFCFSMSAAHLHIILETILKFQSCALLARLCYLYLSSPTQLSYCLKNILGGNVSSTHKIVVIKAQCCGMWL